MGKTSILSARLTHRDVGIMSGFVLARLSKLLIALALAASIGLHWAALQVVAWTGMVISYSQDAPLVEAVSKTFDGRHPCSVCKQIAKARRAERTGEYKFEVSKLEFPRVCEEFTLCPPASFREMRAGDLAGDLLVQPPAVPPPRTFRG